MLQARRWGRWRAAAAVAALAVLLTAALGWIAAPAHARAPAPVELSAARSSVALWPAVTVLADEAEALDVEGALARRAAFVAPTGPASNLGMRRGAVWLHAPLRVGAGGDGRWIVRIDYPPLADVRLVVLRDGRPVQQSQLGSRMPVDARALRARSHAAAIDVEPGGEQALLLRIATAGSTVVPIDLVREGAFHDRENSVQLAHGLFFGVMLALLAYSLGHGAALRDRAFVDYGVTVLGLVVFLAAYSGLGPQHLWPGMQTGVLAKAAPLGALLALAAVPRFVQRAVDTQRRHRALHRLLGAASLAAAVVLAAGAIGALDYRALQRCVAVVGPVSILITLAAVWTCAGVRDPIGRGMLAGCAFEVAGTLAMAALLRGWIAADALTIHLFHAGALLEKLCWVRVLTLRVEAVRHDAQRVLSEREAFASLAHTDALTGLPNRRGLFSALDALLRPGAAPAGGSAPRIAVFLLDLDGFKPVNDRHGHDVGDALLAAVGDRLSARLRRGDVVARLGGDEFVVVAPGLRPAEADALGHTLLAAFARPFDAAGVECSVGTTIGYALAGDDGDAAATLLKRADEALYAGKRSGGAVVRRCSDATRTTVGLAAPRAATAPRAPAGEALNA